MPFIELRHSFDKTNLDLEDSSPSGGPINAAVYGHQQLYTPQNKFKDNPEGQLQGGNLKTDGFNGRENLDLENNGPKNVANYNHQQLYTPQNKFKDNPEGQLQGGNLKTDGFDGRENLDLENNGPTSVRAYGHQQNYTPQPGQGYEDSPQGKLRSPDSAAEKNNFKTSALDLESSEAGVKQGGEGGPNRTVNQTKSPFQSGQYTVKRAGGPGHKGSDVGGEVIKQTLHRYTPQSTYLDNSPIQTSANFTPKNNTTTEGGANGFDATLK